MSYIGLDSDLIACPLFIVQSLGKNDVTGQCISNPNSPIRQLRQRDREKGRVIKINTEDSVNLLHIKS